MLNDQAGSDVASTGDVAAPDQASMDPLAMVDAHVEAGTASPQRERVETPPEVAALVSSWWDRTRETAEFTKAVKQTDEDQLTLDGGTPYEIADQGEVTVNHVYRNAIATVAMVVPEMESVDWRPREQVEPLPGQAPPPQYEEARQQRQGLAAVMGVLFRRFAYDCNLQEKIEAFVQDGTHFPMAVLKCWFQRDLEADPLSDERLPDEQDLLARARVLVEQFDRGEFTKTDHQYEELRLSLLAVGKTELAVRRGIVVEQVPIQQYRIDPSVTGPEHVATASWERQDVLMRRDEILAKWPEIDPDDLSVCSTWTLDETGKAIKALQDSRTSSARDIAPTTASSLPNQINGTDWLLAAEIYDYVHNTRLVLIEGLEYPAVEEPIERGPTGMSPFVQIVMNRRSGQLYGFSDTQLQSKLQGAINRLQTQEEDARKNAQPRWAYDPASITDEKAIKAIQDAEPWSMFPIATAKGNLKDALVPLAGNHEYNENEYDPTRLETRMRAMAMLPEQALGVTGRAHFAAEVDVAASGANAMARYRQTRVIRALRRLYDKIAQLILFNVPQELAIRYAGPMAAVYYPAKPMDRSLIYEGLDIVVDVKLDQQLDYARRADSLVKMLDVLSKLGQKPNPTFAAKLLGKFLGMEDEATDLFQSNPNDLVGLLAQSMQQQPGAMAPQALQALMQMGAAAQQQLMQMIAQQQQQQAAAQQPPGGGAPPGAGGGMPPPGQQQAAPGLSASGAPQVMAGT